MYETSAVNTISATTIPGANGVALASNGDIIAGGTTAPAGLSGITVWAFKPTGALDSSFGTSGSTSTTFGPTIRGEGNALAIGGDGKIVVAGDTKTITGSYSGVAARYNGFASAPPPPLVFRVSLSGLSGSYKTSVVAKKGLKFALTCNQACTYNASLVLSAGTARRLHIQTTVTKCTKVKGKRRCVKVRRFRAVTIASSRGSLKAAGTRSITLRLRRTYVKTLERQRSVPVTLKVSATSRVTHKTRTVTKGLKLTR